MSYTMTAHINSPIDEAELAIRSALADEGFGILTEIDVEATFRKKLGDKAGEEVGPYRILGACNPVLAHKAIGADSAIGALLPCNVVVRASADGGTDVVAIDPDAMMGVAAGDLSDVATEARERLTRALAAVSSG